jgi:glycosyltransferase involved in cell wall biosynthesis
MRDDAGRSGVMAERAADPAATRQTIGVVIRTLNESELIGTCVETLRRQHGPFDLDIIVVDSGSTDGTVEIARSNGSRILELPPGDFDYSKALNLGIEAVRGDLVVSLSAHAIPVDDHWLERLTSPFDDPRVAGASSRQVPWPDAPWQEVHRLKHQFDETRRVYGGGGDDIVFSNAASVVRRSVWLRQPFTLPAVEDLDWAKRVVAAGWTIIYEPGTAVYHSHYENARAQARRMIDINRVSDDGGARTLRRTVREAVGLLVRDGRKILGLDEPLRRKVAYLADLLLVVCYYVLDFTRAGTTAERRRADAH